MPNGTLREQQALPGDHLVGILLLRFCDLGGIFRRSQILSNLFRQKYLTRICINFK
ncbi:hypothetical protein [Calothrix rhizosoleniae]|uniref:hypothetical protein n=1 Tax=Calothrix rhizosoleniae TaxID=888997 RepID=UPI001356394D|nr:hypothetical protein [Calothrix rhizosoleniae]